MSTIFGADILQPQFCLLGYEINKQVQLQLREAVCGECRNNRLLFKENEVAQMCYVSRRICTTRNRQQLDDGFITVILPKDDASQIASAQEIVRAEDKSERDGVATPQAIYFEMRRFVGHIQSQHPTKGCEFVKGLKSGSEPNATALEGAQHKVRFGCRRTFGSSNNKMSTRVVGAEGDNSFGARNPNRVSNRRGALYIDAFAATPDDFGRTTVTTHRSEQKKCGRSDISYDNYRLQGATFQSRR